MEFTSRHTRPRKREVTVGITGKYAALRDAYASIDKAIEHCSAAFSTDINLDWIDATEIEWPTAADRLGDLDAVIVPGGFGVRGVEGKISVARYCREAGIPYLGICLGFQVAVIDFARHVLGLEGAGSTEFDQATVDPVISELPDQKKIEGLGGTMRLGAQDVLLRENTLASFLFGSAKTVRERFRHRYEVDPAYIDRFESAGLVYSGRHPSQPIMQVLELPTSDPQDREGISHPYFIGAQFHPELTSRPLQPQPMFLGLVAAAIRRRQERGSAWGQSAPWQSDPEVARWIRNDSAGVQRV
jgi:CTP synthase